MANSYTGTSANDSWTLVSPGTFTLDGAGGTDTLNLGNSLRSNYTLAKAADGSVILDSISSASGGALLHATLYNMEVLTFSNGSDVLNLTTYFGPPADTTPPTISSFSPASSATGVALASNIVATFSEAVQRGTGSIVLKNAAGTTIETFDAASSGLLSVSGTTLTINPTNNLANVTNYFVTFASGTIKDLAGNAYAGATTYNFTTIAAPVAPVDTAPPTVSSFSPAAAATGVDVASNIVVTFSEAVQRGTGSIVLKNAAGTTIETFDAASSGLLSVSGTTLTINPTNNLASGTNYFVTFAPSTIKDLAGNAYAGTTTYNFTTSAATTASTPQTGTADNDIFHETAGNNSINGGAGIDKIIYAGNRSAYTINTANGSTLVHKPSSSSDTDTLTNVERLQFADTKVAMDLDGNANAGITAKILGAVFGQGTSSNPMNPTYVGIGLSYLDGGMSYTNLMKLALDAVGATTSTAVVNLLWTNLFGVAPTAAEAAPYIAMIDNGPYNAGTLGVLAADTSYNTNHINLVGLAQTGIIYS